MKHPAQQAVTALCLCLLTLLPQTTAAQIDQSGVLLIADPACAEFITDKPVTPASVTEAQSRATTLTGCITNAMSRLPRLDGEGDLTPDPFAVPVIPAAASRPATLARTLTDDSINVYLINRHFEYKALKRAVENVRDIAAGNSSATTASSGAYYTAHYNLTRLGRELHDLMDARGLRESFSAALVTGGVLSNMGFDGSDFGDVRPVPEGRTQPQVHLAWESMHFGSSGLRVVEFSLGGRLGFVPALALFNLPEGSAAADTMVTVTGTDTTMVVTPLDSTAAQFSDAFVWSLGAQLNLPTGGRDEVSFGGLLGQTHLNATTDLVKRGEDDILEITLSEAGHRTAWFGEIVLQYNRFDNPLEVMHSESSFLSPVFHVSTGFRLDNRLRPEGDLVLPGSPHRRFFFRFLIDALKFVDQREEGEEGRTFTIGFGVNYERPLDSASPIPSVTRFTIRGDLDFLKALQGGG